MNKVISILFLSFLLLSVDNHKKELTEMKLVLLSISRPIVITGMLSMGTDTDNVLKC